MKNNIIRAIICVIAILLLTAIISQLWIIYAYISHDNLAAVAKNVSMEDMVGTWMIIHDNRGGLKNILQRESNDETWQNMRLTLRNDGTFEINNLSQGVMEHISPDRQAEKSDTIKGIWNIEWSPVRGHPDLHEYPCITFIRNDILIIQKSFTFQVEDL